MLQQLVKRITILPLAVGRLKLIKEEVIMVKGEIGVWRGSCFRVNIFNCVNPNFYDPPPLPFYVPCLDGHHLRTTAWRHPFMTFSLRDIHREKYYSLKIVN